MLGSSLYGSAVELLRDDVLLSDRFVLLGLLLSWMRWASGLPVGACLEGQGTC